MLSLVSGPSVTKVEGDRKQAAISFVCSKLLPGVKREGQADINTK